MAYNKFITCSDDLVTTHEATRSGFLEYALEKNRLGDPFVKEALTFKSMVCFLKDSESLLALNNVRYFLLSASGLSDKALTHLDEDDQKVVLREFIDKYLKPAGDRFVDETIYRYLLNKGDAVGGEMRNRVGAIAQAKLTRKFISVFSVRHISFLYYDKPSKTWVSTPLIAAGIEESIGGFRWTNSNGDRLLTFNETNSLVGKNIDINLFSYSVSCEYAKANIATTGLMFGELKGGIDPAGADEHWKTGNSALGRIRIAFSEKTHRDVLTCFLGGAIEKAMSVEIFNQLNNGTLSNAANLTDENQFTELVNWMVDL